MMNKPNFFIVGAPKCGTTALSEYLKNHPDIFVPVVKEPHYFATDFEKFRTISNKENYENLYADTDAAYFLDASVWYLYSKEALKNIQEFNPESKVIVMLRKPSEMVISLHAQLLYTLDEKENDFEKAWKLQGERKQGKQIPETCREREFLQYKAVASYAHQIERLFGIIDKQNIKIILFDDFVRETGQIYNEVIEFLNLPEDHQQSFEKINARKTHKSKFVAKLIHRPPQFIISGIKKVKELFGIKEFNVISKLDKMNQKESDKYSPDVKLEMELRNAFKPDIKKLEKLIGRDLSFWY